MKKVGKVESIVKNVWGNVLFYTLFLGAIPFAIYFLRHPIEEILMSLFKTPVSLIIPPAHIVGRIMGFIALFFGIFLNVVTLLVLWKRGKGTNAITDQSKMLVVEGPFKVVRNPCHLGVIISIMGYALITSSVLYIVYAIIYFLCNDIYLRVYEEKLLEKKFGIQYVVYKQNVPKWFPISFLKRKSS